MQDLKAPTDIVSLATQVTSEGMKAFFSLFKKTNKPNPDDWKGWKALDAQIGAPVGTNCINWIINDGDSVTNEAANIQSYIQEFGTDDILIYSPWFNRTITPDDIKNKLIRAGFVEPKQEIIAPDPVSSFFNNANKNGGILGSLGLPQNTVEPTIKTAGFNWKPLAIIALIASLFYAAKNLFKGFGKKKAWLLLPFIALGLNAQPISNNSVNNQIYSSKFILNTGYSKKSGGLNISTSSPIIPLAKFHAGNRNVLNSSAAQILVGGFYNNSVPTNGHAFADNSELNKTGSWAYASYDGRVDITGTGVSADHYVSYQAAPNYAFSGTMLDNFGTYITHSISSGTITNNYGHFIANPTKTSSGVISNNYAVYIANQTAGSTNYSIYSAGGFNYLAGPLQVGSTLNADYTGSNIKLKGGETGTTDGGIYINAIGNLFLADWDGTRGFVTLGNGNGYYFGGNFGVKTATPSKEFDVVGSGQVSANFTAQKYYLSALNSPPSSSTDTGVTGEIRFTSNYIYLCISTNNWVRSTLSTF